MTRDVLPAGLAVGLVLVAMAILGTDWSGIEVSPGAWRDRVTPQRWAVFHAVLLGVAMASARWVPGWLRRAGVLVPLLAWLTWQLQAGTLWPVALAVYGTAAVVTWVLGLVLGDSVIARRSS